MRGDEKKKCLCTLYKIDGVCPAGCEKFSRPAHRARDLKLKQRAQEKLARRRSESFGRR